MVLCFCLLHISFGVSQVMEYEYEAEMEETYRTSMFKTFKKTLDDGFFPFIILDAINDRVRHFDQFWSAAKTKGFEVKELQSTLCYHVSVAFVCLITIHSFLGIFS